MRSWLICARERLDMLLGLGDLLLEPSEHDLRLACACCARNWRNSVARVLARATASLLDGALDRDDEHPVGDRCDRVRAEEAARALCCSPSLLDGAPGHGTALRQGHIGHNRTGGLLGGVGHEHTDVEAW